MRRFALLGLAVLVPGCRYAGSPLDGFGKFAGDTHTYHVNANVPPAQSENERRVRGQDITIAPLMPEPGDVWPGPPPPIPTLQDVQKLNNNQALPPPNIPTEPPPAVFPQNSPSNLLQTPQGAVTPYNGGNGITTFQSQGGVGLVVPNANGTNTIIQPDGSIQTAPRTQ